MAAADIVHTEWGYLVGGTDTDARTVDTGTLWIKAIGFSGNGDDATATLTTTRSDGATVSCMKFKTNGWDLDASNNFVYFGEQGRPFTELIVTLGHASDTLYIFLT